MKKMDKKKKKEIPESVIRKKTINIFIIRKIAEITIVFAIIFLPYIMGYYILGKESKWCGSPVLFDTPSEPNPIVSCEGHYIKIWFIGLVWLIIAAIAIGLIIYWIMWNWEEAKYEAKSKLGCYN
jgi:hypothetical protein